MTKSKRVKLLAGGKTPETRYLDIYEGELDEKQFASWVTQAAALPGWIA